MQHLGVLEPWNTGVDAGRGLLVACGIGEADCAVSELSDPQPDDQYHDRGSD
jgi:hypothetical protein